LPLKNIFFHILISPKITFSLVRNQHNTLNVKFIHLNLIFMAFVLVSPPPASLIGGAGVEVGVGGSLIPQPLLEVGRQGPCFGLQPQAGLPVTTKL
jgi:hypothetical protein